MTSKAELRHRRNEYNAQAAWNSTYKPAPVQSAPAAIIVETNDSPLRYVPLHEIIATPNYRDEYEQEFIDTIASNMADHGFDPAHAIEVYATPAHWPKHQHGKAPASPRYFRGIVQICTTAQLTLVDKIFPPAGRFTKRNKSEAERITDHGKTNCCTIRHS